MKILFACSEFYPLLSTGDVADYAAAITATLGHMTHDIRVVMPAYPDAVNRALPVETVTHINIPGYSEAVRILRSRSARLPVPVYMVDAPEKFSRHGHPYLDAAGNPRPDNAESFAKFCHSVVKIALNQTDLNWKADLVHCNDWQTGLVPALLAHDWNRPACVFSCHSHNDAGDFDPELAQALRLPPNLPVNTLLHQEKLSYLKAGLEYADSVILNNQTLYDNLLADEQQSNCAGLLIASDHRLHVFHCPIDQSRWNPVNDSYIKQPYDARSLDLKAANKQWLIKQSGITGNTDKLLLAVFSDISSDEQPPDDVLSMKLLQNMLQQLPLILAFDYSSNAKTRKQLQTLQQQFPQQVIITAKPDESRLHYLLAAADAALFADSSKITNLRLQYSLAYGTVAILHSPYTRNDFVRDATSDNLLANKANGYLYGSTQNELLPVTEKMVKYYQRPGPWWRKLVINAMNTDSASAPETGKLVNSYQYAIDHPRAYPSRPGI